MKLNYQTVQYQMMKLKNEFKKKLKKEEENLNLSCLLTSHGLSKIS
jgi:hypothetical protein